ncbi:MAG: proteasome accessory factor PafA2 family protein [Candidatus Syntrophoarchaeum sp.]|nr:proteasome accessory factor PafA2 family protein [Candidatus Syntrophoarchaeum sp.]
MSERRKGEGTGTGTGTGTENKIRGIEQEYPVTAKATLNPSLLVNAAIQGLKRRRFSRDVKWDTATEVSQEAHESRITSSYGDNGCRIYNDMGHLEIATPSYNNPFDAVAYDKVSEIYAFAGSREASRTLKKKVVIHKNNVANFFSRVAAGSGIRIGKGEKIKTNTYATHGNIITKREACKDWNRVEKALIPWVVTRILFTGSGDVVSGDTIGKEGVKFVISPRAMFVVQKSSLSTTLGRGILNTRDQPHAARQYWRLHDIHYEALRSEYAIFLRDVAQAMVICAFESGFLDDAPEIDDPVRAFKKISADTQECEWKIKLKNGEMTDAVSILRFYLEGIEKMYEEKGEEEGKWDEMGRRSLKEVIEKLEARRVEEYVDGIDWVTKLALLVNYEPKSASEGISICNQYALLDESVLYCIVDGEESTKGSCLCNPKESLAFAKKELPQVDWSSLSDRVKYALSNAPERTREFFKVEMLKRYGSHVRSVSWSTMVLNEAKIILDEPFMLTKEEIGAEMIEGREIEEVLSAAKRLYPEKIIY